MYRSETQTALSKNILYFLRWTAISIVMGIVCGLIGTIFGYGVIYAQRLFKTYSFMLYLMPVAGVLIVLLHQMFHEIGNRGTNLILESISSNEKIHMTTLPCIFVSTILSQAVGASAGKEGAALQIGGCIGNYLGDLFHMDERDKKVMIMSGMSGCFGAIFGTPLAAAMFGIEVISIGVAYYAALVPCVFASFIGAQISGALGLHGEAFQILHVPEFSLVPALYTVGLGLACALLSVCFCILLHETQHLYKKKIDNVYLRILVAAVLSIGLALVFGRDYCGSGFNLVEQAVEGDAGYLAFFFKWSSRRWPSAAALRAERSFPHWQWDLHSGARSDCSQVLNRPCVRQQACSPPSSASQTARSRPCSSASSSSALRRCRILRLPLPSASHCRDITGFTAARSSHIQR